MRSDLANLLSPDEVRALPRLPPDAYLDRALTVAPRLLGTLLVSDSPEPSESEHALTAGIITETEAYEGPEDRACHAFGGRRTPRNEVMWGHPGRAYVYFTYGMHYMLNVVVAGEGTPHAVLIRSIHPVSGISLMQKRRGGKTPLGVGPGRLCQAMAIGRSHNGVDLSGDSLYIADLSDMLLELLPASPPVTPIGSRARERKEPCEEGDYSHLPPDLTVCRTARIGIDYAKEAKDYLWRFVLERRAFQ